MYEDEWDSLSDMYEDEWDSLSDMYEDERDSLSDTEDVDFVDEGDTVVTGAGSILVVAEGDTVVVGMVDRLHPVAASQLVVSVLTSMIRMVGFGPGALPADTSDAVGQ